MDLECFSCFEQVLAFSSLVGGLRYVLTRDRMTDFLCFSVSSSVVHLAVFLVISYMCTHVVDTSLHQAIDRSRRQHPAVHIHVSPILTRCIVENFLEVVPSFPCGSGTA